jgi:anti-sigma regulatory factor (Ser/Thr protein kinase)
MNGCTAPIVPAPDSVERYPGGADWSLQSHLLTPALPAAVTIARHHVTGQLVEWQMEGHCETAEIVASELVTNAIRAATLVTRGAPCVRLWLSSDHDRVLVQVWDPCEAKPVLRSPSPEAIGGRGLLLIDALSTDWGTYTPATMTGKIVWAVIRLLDSPQPQS